MLKHCIHECNLKEGVSVNRKYGINQWKISLYRALIISFSILIILGMVAYALWIIKPKYEKYLSESERIEMMVNGDPESEKNERIQLAIRNAAQP